MIHQAVIDRILQSLDLPAFIGERVALAKHSKTYEGLCPFHLESSASFKVFCDHYHCFGCGAHGNAIDFLIGHQGLSFPEAVRALAAHTGVEVPSSREGRFKADGLWGLRTSLRRACAEYQRLLLSPQGAGALAVLSERGIEHDTIVRFGIGFVPDAWGTLTKARGCDRRSLVAAGLAVQRKGNRGCYDFFRNRLMLPVSSDSDEMVGFGGRRIGLERPKYLNTPETALYKKGLVLFGLHQARQAIRTTGSVIVCEGFFVVFTPSQAGVEPIVSTCGTALTLTQAERVLPLAERVFFCFDGDAAGAKATWRAAKMLLPLVRDHHEIRLCRLPAGEDPDSFVRTRGAQAFREALDAAPSLAAYLVGEMTRGAMTPEARAKALAMVGMLWQRTTAPGLSIFFRQYACEALRLSPHDFDRVAATARTGEPSGHAQACPCCGGRAMALREDGGHRIRCRDCRLSTAVTATAEQCQSLWNRRERPRPAQALPGNEEAYHRLT